MHRTIGKDFISFKNLEKTIEQGHSMFLRYYFSEKLHKLVPYVFVARLIYSKDKENPIGVVMVGSDILEELDKIIGQANDIQNVDFAVLTEDGIIFSASDPSLVGKYFTPIPSDVRKQIIKSGQMGDEKIAEEPLPIIRGDRPDYFEFIYDDKVHHSMMSFSRAHQRVILLDSVSKRFSACGARIVCLASKNKKVIQAVTKFAQARLSSPMVEQLAIVPLLKNPKKYTQKIVKEYKRRRDTVFEELQKIPGVECLKPKGAFYTIVKLPVKDAEDFTKWLLTKFSYKGKTLMLAPASGFYATLGLGKDEVRIAFVLSPQKLKGAIEVLKKGLEKYKKNK